MKVKVVDRKAMRADWGNPGPIRIITREIKISDYCPKCGGDRGLPERRPFYESGQGYTADCWHNPCGHIDKYEDVLTEVKNESGI